MRLSVTNFQRIIRISLSLLLLSIMLKPQEVNGINKCSGSKKNSGVTKSIEIGTTISSTEDGTILNTYSDRSSPKRLLNTGISHYCTPFYETAFAKFNRYFRYFQKGPQ